ncbi:hypothetical protein [Streptomyces sp. CBMA152]|uniref:hypothetical protein n=1 Tax=Streptomyces sp. CBMA152 TaxID=1896312 RepID=UPI0016615D61|nr:hypothetical protein [Streptomyces sp. CBMA152]MBD0744952.1 hypothetical protein [Streptomyces sp. CBMA152]
MTGLGRVPVIIYLALPDDDTNPEPYLLPCREFAARYGYGVRAELTGRLTGSGRRPFRKVAREAMEAGRARGLITYTRPMLATRTETWAELAKWAGRRPAFIEAAWQPVTALGSLVYDTAHGRTGRLVAFYPDGLAWLRPDPAGGQEWTTDPDCLMPPLTAHAPGGRR